MTSHFPRPPYTQEELQTLYPPALELTQAHVYFRHGERTPISQRLTGAGLPGFWPFCSMLERQRSPVLLPDHDIGHPPEVHAQIIYWRKKFETWSAASDSPALAYPNIRQGEPSHGRQSVETICEQGMLTDRGRETTTALGQRLRQLYVRDLGFLPGVLTPTFVREEACFRSTTVPRAMESLMQALGGLWPSGRWDNQELYAKPASVANLVKSKLGWNQAAEPSHDVTSRTEFGSFPIDMVFRMTADENLYPNDWNCRRLAQLMRSFANRRRRGGIPAPR